MSIMNEKIIFPETANRDESIQKETNNERVNDIYPILLNNATVLFSMHE